MSKRRWFQIHLSTAIGIFVVLSILLGIAIIGWPYHRAWSDMKRFVHEGRESDSIASHFGSGKFVNRDPALYAYRRGLRHEDRAFRETLIFSTIFLKKDFGLDLVPDLIDVSLHDSDADLRGLADHSAGELLTFVYAPYVFEELKKLENPTRQEIESVVRKVLASKSLP